MRFDEIEWHDQILSSIDIDRSNPGNKDYVRIQLIINGKKGTIEFTDVYHAELKMNFGIIAEESIRYAVIESNDKELANIREKWQRAGAKLDNLNCYHFNTNSTNSTIKIYASGYSFNFIN